MYRGAREQTYRPRECSTCDYSVITNMLCGCYWLPHSTLSSNFVYPNIVLFPVCVVVEEILVCFDGSQPEVLQGFNCRGGEPICSLLHISVLNSCLFYFMFDLCVTSGFWPGWWDRPVDLLQCNWVPGATQLWLPNTCKRLFLLIKCKCFSMYTLLLKNSYWHWKSVYIKYVLI